MEISSHHQEGEIPIPINSAYGDGHHMNIHHHHHQQQHQPHNHMIINPNSSSTNIPPNNNGSSMPSSTTLHDEDDDDDDDEHGHDRDDDDDHIPMAAAVAAVAAVPSSFNNKKVVVHDPVVNTNNSNIIVRYRECLKNHAASMGANATDGCGEFMPSGEDGTIEALKCSACNCHRNFHRKEIEGTGSINIGPSSSRKFILGSVPYHHHHHQNKGGNYPIPSRTVPPLIPSAHHHHQLIMPYNNNVMNMGSHHHDRDHQPELSEQHPHHQHGTGSLVVAARPPAAQGVTRKRFRTKFTQEQKEKMLNFAEKVGWKIQKQEESVVHQLCQEIGVKRRVLKVWMHNNKHNLAKKNNLPSS